MTTSRGRILFLLALILSGFATYVALTGGVDTRIAGIAVRSRSWERPAAVAAILAAWGVFSFRRQEVEAAVRRAAAPLPILAACWAGIAALVFGTFAAGGADSYGYVSQAELLAHGRLTDALPRNRAFTWPDVAQTLAPLGYRPGPTRHTLAPTYPPGLPLLMAPLAAIHPRGVFLVVPLCAAAAAWFCFLLGRKLDEPLVGGLSALLFAISPTFLYQAVQPMSDVPVTAFWTGALALSRHPKRWSAPATGLVVAVAVLIRPNLAPLALFVIVAAATVSTRVDLRRALGCALGILPGLIALAAIQYVRYGSPLASGYGSVSDLFALGNIAPNLSRYPRWLTETHTAFVWLWLLAPIGIVRAAENVRTFAWTCYGFSVAVFAAYLPYSYFRPEESSYTRFLLPALPFMLIFGVSVVFGAARRIVPTAAAQAAALLILVVAGGLVVRSVAAGTFHVWEAEQKYPSVGAFVRDRLPQSAFVMAMQHSGSIRYYSGRHTLRWDFLDRASLGEAISALLSAGYSPFAVLDLDEDEEFRKRFTADSPEAIQRMVEVGRIGHTLVYAFQ